MWQVHFTIKEDGGQGELVLNSLELVSKEKETSGRFTLYPTEYFLILDKIDCNVYQVQWSMDEKAEVFYQLSKNGCLKDIKKESYSVCENGAVLLLPLDTTLQRPTYNKWTFAN